MDTINNKAVATKVMADIPRAYDEMCKLQCLGHPNIIDVHDFFESNGFGNLVMSLMNMNLLIFIADISYDSTVMLDIMTQIARGIEHMHIRGVLHLDVKPENIGVVKSPTNQIQCRILDLGSSICVDSVKMGYVVHTTPEFRAPEFATGMVGSASDIYSMGKVFSVLIQNSKTILCYDEFKQLVREMTDNRCNTRPIANEVLSRLGERDLGQQAVSGPFWESMVANMVDGDSSLLVCDTSNQLHKIVTLICSNNLECVENAFWLLQEAARRELAADLCPVSVLSIMSYFSPKVSVSKITALFYTRALSFLSQLPYFLLTDDMKVHLWRISVFPCCEQNILRVLARSYSPDLLTWCRLAAGWGSRRDHFVDFLLRFQHMKEALICLADL